ncbi:MAG TPA: 3-oxoadipate enol-lactonase, partial [Yoonia sp.]|nr:3-oxoadipate enol-lactonase [Yoonia sp.]
MQEQMITRPDGTGIYAQITGPQTGPAVVFSNSLGTTLHLWDAVLPFLPEGLRILRYDMRGHGLSDAPEGP